MSTFSSVWSFQRRFVPPQAAILAWLALVPTGLVAFQKPPTVLRFDFGTGEAAPGYVKVGSDTVYSDERGYGFDLNTKPQCFHRTAEPLVGELCASDKPFYFSAALPEGTYRVTLTFGDPERPATTTVKSESRRLMLERVKTRPGESVSRSFLVNIRTPALPDGGQVRLKPREVGVLHWDGKLTLEFSDSWPAISALTIEAAQDVVTVFLMGDSTVTDQTQEPWNSWGQMLPRFFREPVVVANYAESGESARSSIAERRLEKVLSLIRPGDYLFIQFGHNDEKEKGEGVGPFTTYKTTLERYVEEARKRGAQPVLITPMHRRTFDSEGRVTNSHGDYPEAVRQLARERNVPLIDLTAMSQTLYEALGADGSVRAFVDGTHHNSYGSYLLAQCIVEGVRANRLGLAKYIAGDVGPFDPSKPMPFEDFAVPPSPGRSTVAPAGS